MQDILWKLADGLLLDFFEDMTDDEARAFFEKYMALREDRLGALKRRFWISGFGNEDDLNFEPSTLEDLWVWASRLTRREELTDQEHDHLRKMSEPVRALYRTRFTTDTLILLNDIGYYFGEVVVRSLRGVHWAVCKTKLKRYIDQNQPVLSGFTAPGYEFGVNPRTTVLVIADKAVDGRGSDADLLWAYERCYEAVG